MKSSAATVQVAVCGAIYASTFSRTEKFLVLRKMSVSSPKTRSSEIDTGRRSIYNICILNYCKLTFEFFKNSIFKKRRQFLNRILGGDGTDAAGYKPHDVCVSKLEFNIVQGCTMLNGWHRMATERLPVDKLFRLQMREVHCSGVFDA